MKTLSVAGLKRSYRAIKPQIKKRILEFSLRHNDPDKEVFSELCFCILTANANALRCDDAIKELKAAGLLLNGSACRIKPKLVGRVRFHNKKAEFIVRARDLFSRGTRLEVKKYLNKRDIVATRDWLVEHIKGYGYKEASHFLRNIGLGQDIAILDRHILKNLKHFGVIAKVPPSTGSRKVYMAIEEKMRKFSKGVGIPLEDLDLLFWSLQTGFIFK